MNESITVLQPQDIHVVILHKDEGTGLGFSIAGGSDLESKAPTVSHCKHESSVQKDASSIQRVAVV